MCVNNPIFAIEAILSYFAQRNDHRFLRFSINHNFEYPTHSWCTGCRIMELLLCVCNMYQTNIFNQSHNIAIVRRKQKKRTAGYKEYQDGQAKWKSAKMRLIGRVREREGDREKERENRRKKNCTISIALKTENKSPKCMTNIQTMKHGECEIVKIPMDKLYRFHLYIHCNMYMGLRTSASSDHKLISRRMNWTIFFF